MTVLRSFVSEVQGSEPLPPSDMASLSDFNSIVDDYHELMRAAR